MPLDDIDNEVKSLVGMQENPHTLVRFEDDTDKNAPRLSYAVPLPGSFEGRFYLQMDPRRMPWRPAAFLDLRVTEAPDFTFPGDKAPAPRPEDTGGRRHVFNPALSARAKAVSLNAKGAPAKAAARVGREPQSEAAEEEPAPTATAALMSPGTAIEGEVVARNGEWVLETQGISIPWSEVTENAAQGRALVLYRSLGGSVRRTYKQEARGKEDANPRFVIIEHYRMSSFFGNYGAGKTVSVFSLMPGEETKLYIRHWRRSDQKKKEASSVFDSYTQEAADEFSESMESENTDREAMENSKSWHVKASASCNFGCGFAGGSASVEGGKEGSSKSARESMSKSVGKSATHHASKASSKRDISVSTELEVSEAEEYETITERVIKNVNLSRTLNIVTRELNQEFTTYLHLVDVTVAFVNDLNVFDEFHIHEIDRMLLKYLSKTGGGTKTPKKAGNVPVVPLNKTIETVRKELVKQIRTVFDYEGVQHDFLEEVDGIAGEKYLRVRRPKAGHTSAFYAEGKVPVEGIVMNVSRHTVRTDAVIIDSLLGHGVALDNYALATQQEVLVQKQLENRKIELALQLIEAGDDKRLEAWRSLFGSVDGDLLKQVALD